jgi:hypothetical protein
MEPNEAKIDVVKHGQQGHELPFENVEDSLQQRK